jgi:hypothetical protein
MTTTVITSFSKDGWHEYGRRMVETFESYWPAEIKLICYYEFEPPVVSFPNRIEWRDLMAIPHVEEFLSRTSTDQYKGFRADQDDSNKLVYQYRMDANKFSRKAFCWYDAWLKIYEAEKTDDQRRLLVWLDADTYTHNAIPSGFIEGLLPDGKGMAFLGREQIGMYPESGFVAWDCDAPGINTFFQLCWNMYAAGGFVFMREWHDCYAMELIKRLLATDAHNLSPEVDDMHPFVFSQLGQYMDHLKGPKRKTAGRTIEHPYLGDADAVAATNG